LPGFVDAVHEVGGDRNKLSVLGTPAHAVNGTSFDTMTLNPFVPDRPTDIKGEQIEPKRI